MKMYDFQRQLQELSQAIPELEIPLEKNIEIPDPGNILDMEANELNHINRSVNKTAWRNILLVSGFAIGLWYLLKIIPKNESYQGFTQRRQAKQSNGK
jgi:hypothetical protein